MGSIAALSFVFSTTSAGLRATRDIGTAADINAISNASRHRQNPALIMHKVASVITVREKGSRRKDVNTTVDLDHFARMSQRNTALLHSPGKHR